MRRLVPGSPDWLSHRSILAFLVVYVMSAGCWRILAGDPWQKAVGVALWAIPFAAAPLYLIYYYRKAKSQCPPEYWAVPTDGRADEAPE